MNRRTFTSLLISGLCSLPFAKAATANEIPAIVGVKETPWLKGRVRVFCNDIDVTKHCFRADSERGTVRCYDKANFWKPGQPPMRELPIVVHRGLVRVELIA